MSMNNPPKPDTLVIYDAAMTILAENLALDLIDVPKTEFFLDFSDSLTMAWRFETYFKISNASKSELWQLLLGNKNITEVVESVQKHIHIVCP